MIEERLQPEFQCLLAQNLIIRISNAIAELTALPETAIYCAEVSYGEDINETGLGAIKEEIRRLMELEARISNEVLDASYVGVRK